MKKLRIWLDNFQRWRYRKLLRKLDLKRAELEQMLQSAGIKYSLSNSNPPKITPHFVGERPPIRQTYQPKHSHYSVKRVGFDNP